MGIGRFEVVLGVSDRHVTLEVDSPAMAAWFEERFPSGMEASAQTGNAGRYAIYQGAEGRLLAMGPGRFRLEGDGLEAIAEPLIQHALERLALTADHGLVLHAAGVSLAGVGCVLIGESGSGKSTLTSACLRLGFDYLSDEVICLTISPLAMTGFPRPINLKSGSRFVLDEWLSADARVDVLEPGVCWVDPGALGGGTTVASARPGRLVFPRFVCGAGLEARRLTPAECLLRLLPLAVNRSQSPERVFRLAAEIARDLSSWVLHFSCAIEAAGWLREREV